MKILILGAGQVGRTAAYQLAREEINEVTVIDTNENLLRDLQDRLDIRTVVGNASYPTVLEDAGIREADILIALTSSDEVNMLACEVAYTLYQTKTKIARIRSPEYTRHAALFSDEALSVDVWISPEQLVTKYIERLIRYPGALQVLDFADGRVRLVGLSARKGGLLVGQALRALRDHIPNTEARVVAIYRKGCTVKLNGDAIIEDQDEVFFLAAKDDIRGFMTEMRKEEKPARRIIIAGGGHIGLALAMNLEKSNQVKVIERNPDRARKISEKLQSAIVLVGDSTDEELLIEENIDSCDVFVAVTNSEESNMLSSMLSKRLGAAKVMALINKPAYAELMHNGSIDIAISPATITIGSLLAYVRRGDVVKVHSLRRGATEALEAIIHGDSRSSRVVGKRIEEIMLPEGTSIGCIVRGELVLMAHHDSIVQADDHIILFISDRRHINAVERLFLGETSLRR